MVFEQIRKLINTDTTSPLPPASETQQKTAQTENNSDDFYKHIFRTISQSEGKTKYLAPELTYSITKPLLERVYTKKIKIRIFQGGKLEKTNWNVFILTIHSSYPKFDDITAGSVIQKLKKFDFLPKSKSYHCIRYETNNPILIEDGQSIIIETSRKGDYDVYITEDKNPYIVKNSFSSKVFLVKGNINVPHTVYLIRVRFGSSLKDLFEAIEDDWLTFEDDYDYKDASKSFGQFEDFSEEVILKAKVMYNQEDLDKLKNRILGYRSKIDPDFKYDTNTLQVTDQRKHRAASLTSFKHLDEKFGDFEGLEADFQKLSLFQILGYHLRQAGGERLPGSGYPSLLVVDLGLTLKTMTVPRQLMKYQFSMQMKDSEPLYELWTIIHQYDVEFGHSSYTITQWIGDQAEGLEAGFYNFRGFESEIFYGEDCKMENIRFLIYRKVEKVGREEEVSPDDKIEQLEDDN